MGLKPFGSRRDCSNSEASPRNDLQDGEREYLARCFSSPGCREGRGPAFSVLPPSGLAGDARGHAPRGVRGRKKASFAAETRSWQPATDGWGSSVSTRAPSLCGQPQVVTCPSAGGRLEEEVRALLLHLGAKAAGTANVPTNQHQPSRGDTPTTPTSNHHSSDKSGPGRCETPSRSISPSLTPSSGPAPRPWCWRYCTCRESRVFAASFCSRVPLSGR